MVLTANAYTSCGDKDIGTQALLVFRFINFDLEFASAIPSFALNPQAVTFCCGLILHGHAVAAMRTDNLF